MYLLALLVIVALVAMSAFRLARWADLPTRSITPLVERRRAPRIEGPRLVQGSESTASCCRDTPSHTADLPDHRRAGETPAGLFA
jgi:hypothetical protein